jgi:hypothetical protein
VADAMVDYRPVAIAGKDFTLPFHSEVHMTYDERRFTNKIDYKAYHKFAASATIRMDADGDAPPTQ